MGILKDFRINFEVVCKISQHVRQSIIPLLRLIQNLKEWTYFSYRQISKQCQKSSEDTKKLSNETYYRTRVL